MRRTRSIRYFRSLRSFIECFLTRWSLMLTTHEEQMGQASCSFRRLIAFKIRWFSVWIDEGEFCIRSMSLWDLEGVLTVLLRFRMLLSWTELTCCEGGLDGSEGSVESRFSLNRYSSVKRKNSSFCCSWLERFLLGLSAYR